MLVFPGLLSRVLQLYKVKLNLCALNVISQQPERGHRFSPSQLLLTDGIYLIFFFNVAVPKRAPQIITVRALNNSFINVTWDALSKQDFQGAAQGYKILYKEMNSTAKYEVLTEYGAIYTTVVGNLKSGTWYTVRVLAFNVYGDGPPGAVANVETQGETIIIRGNGWLCSFIFGSISCLAI